MFHGGVAPLVDGLDALEQVKELVEHSPLLRQQVLQLLTHQLQLGALGLDAVEGKVVVLEQLLTDLAQLPGLGPVHG